MYIVNGVGFVHIKAYISSPLRQSLFKNSSCFQDEFIHDQNVNKNLNIVFHSLKNESVQEKNERFRQ